MPTHQLSATPRRIVRIPSRKTPLLLSIEPSLTTIAVPCSHAGTNQEAGPALPLGIIPIRPPPARQWIEDCRLLIISLYCKGALSCFFNKFLDDHLHNCCDSKMLRFVLNFEFWSFEFVSDFGFSASDLAAATGRVRFSVAQSIFLSSSFLVLTRILAFS